MKNSAYLLLLLLLFSCGPTKKSVVGTYNRYWGFENYSSLKLKPDNLFEFSGQEGMSFLKTSGNWKVDRNKLFLNSFPDTIKAKKSIIIHETIVPSDSIFLVVLDNNREALPGASVVIYNPSDSLVTSTNIDGTTKLPVQQYDSIQISFIGFTPVTYKGKNNMLKLQLGLSPLPEFRLEKEVWTIRRNKLLDPRFKEDQKRNKYKKKKV